MSEITPILDRHNQINEEGLERARGLGYTTYALTLLRQRVGKTTLAFNVAYHLSRTRSVLLADLCPQCDLTDLVMGETMDRVTLWAALEPATLGPASGLIPEDISYRISSYCDAFKAGRLSYLIPGDPVLFRYAARLYPRLETLRDDTRGREQVLHGLKTILRREAVEKRCELTLLDLDAFFAGATHLGWCAAEALILPLRIDPGSLAALEATLALLADPEGEYASWLDTDRNPPPKVAAIVLDAVGSGRRSTIGEETRSFLEDTLRITERYTEVIAHDDPRDGVVLIEDFLSSGRIAAARGVPLAMLKPGSFHTIDGKRLQVNTSIERYQNQLRYLASLI